MSILFAITCRACGVEIDTGIVCDDCMVDAPAPAITVNGELLSVALDRFMDYSTVVVETFSEDDLEPKHRPQWYDKKDHRYVESGKINDWDTATDGMKHCWAYSSPRNWGRKPKAKK